MPGTQSSGRPGGNPDLVKHQYKISDPNRKEAFTEFVGFKVTPTMKGQLDEMGRKWAAFVRDAIEEKLARDSQSTEDG